MTVANPNPFVRVACALGLCCLFVIGCGKSGITTGGGGGGGGGGSPDGGTISKANFDKIKDGMSEKEVIDILGHPTASADIDMNKTKDMLKGMPLEAMPVELPGLPIPKMTLKSWEDGDNLYGIAFKDGKVAGKHFESKKGKVTKENADQIKVGMTRAEVEVLLGKGKTQAGVQIPGYSGEVTVWEGADGTITVGFANDKVAATGGWVKK